jgi:hypothetical protein|tara:strand:- start:1327 stop:1509 length:183 start_codon:yes stop_codon:yes gene_type:complete
MSKSFDAFNGRGGLGSHQTDLVMENHEKFILNFRRFYRRGDRKTFREWLLVVADMLDELD